MLKDIVAIVGFLMIVLGFYFIYWPISLIVSGLFITSYCIITVWIQTKRDKENESTKQFVYSGDDQGEHPIP